jgi:hypothetical protein
MKRTTVRLEDGLMDRVKLEASRRGETVTSLIEKGLRLMLAQSKRVRSRRRVILPVSRSRGGLLPGVDLADSRALLDIMEGRR